MDNRTIEEIRNNETKLINENKILKDQNEKYKEVNSRIIKILDFFISSENLSKYATLKILMRIKKILK